MSSELIELLKLESKYKEAEKSGHIPIELENQLIRVQSLQKIYYGKGILSPHNMMFEIEPIPSGGAGGFFFGRSINDVVLLNDESAYLKSMIKGIYTFTENYKCGLTISWKITDNISECIPVRIICNKNYQGYLDLPKEFGKISPGTCIESLIDRDNLIDFPLKLYNTLVPKKEQVDNPINKNLCRYYQYKSNCLIFEIPLLKIIVSNDRLNVVSIEILNDLLFNFKEPLFVKEYNDKDRNGFVNDTIHEYYQLLKRIYGKNINGILPISCFSNNNEISKLVPEYDQASIWYRDKDNNNSLMCKLFFFFPSQENKKCYLEAINESKINNLYSQNVLNDFIRTIDRKENRLSGFVLNEDVKYNEIETSIPIFDKYLKLDIPNIGNIEVGANTSIIEIYYYYDFNKGKIYFQSNNYYLLKKHSISLEIITLNDVDLTLGLNYNKKQNLYKIVMISSKLQIDGISGLSGENSFTIKIGDTFEDLKNKIVKYQAQDKFIHLDTNFIYRHIIIDIFTKTKIIIEYNRVSEITILSDSLYPDPSLIYSKDDLEIFTKNINFKFKHTKKK